MSKTFICLSIIGKHANYSYNLYIWTKLKNIEKIKICATNVMVNVQWSVDGG